MVVERRERGEGAEKIDLGEIVSSAVEEGVEALVKRRPRFSGQEGLLMHYIDKKQVNLYVKNVAKEIQRYKDPKEAKKFIKQFYEDLAGYAASGKLLNKKGKELILRDSWEKRARSWFGREAREIVKGEKYLDKVMTSFRDIYELLKNGDYAQRMPELAQAVASVYDMGFFDTAVNVLYEDGLMDKKKYGLFKKAIRKRAEAASAYTTQKIQDYLIPQRAAAVILGVLGLATILTTSNITGGIIGVSKTDLFGLISGILLLSSGVWMWFRKTKK